MKKKLVLFLTLILMISSVVGCAGGGEDQVSSDKKTLRILSSNPLVSKESVEMYKSQNPGIEIIYEYVPAADYSAKFSALAAADEIPDVFWTQSGFYTDQIEQELVMDISQNLKGKNYEGDAIWEETFVPALLDNARGMVESVLGERESYDYGSPFTMTTIAVMYDKTVYDKLGLSEPTSWEEFINNNEKLKSAGYTALSMHNTWIDWYPRLFWDQYCREELTENPKAFEDGSMTFGSKCVKEGLISSKELWDAGFLPENGITADLETMQQMFIQGKLGQFLIAPDKLDYIMNNAPEDMSLATFALPGIAGLPSRSLGGSSNVFAVSASTKYPDEAINFLKFITSKTHFTEIESLKYSNTGLQNLEAEPEVEQLLSGFTNAASGGFSPDIFVPTTINTEISTAFKTDLLPNYLIGTYDLDYVTSELQKLYDSSK